MNRQYIDSFGYIWHTPAGVDPCVALVGTDRMRVSPPSEVKQLRSSSWILSVPLTDFGRIRFDRADAPWFYAGKRSVVIIRPGTTWWQDRVVGQAGPCRGNTLRSSVWMGARRRHSKVLDALTPGRSGYAIVDDASERIAVLIQRGVALAREEGESAFWQVQAIFCQLLAVIQEYQFSRADRWWRPRHSAPDDLSTRVDALLERRLAEPICLQEIATALDVSVSTLSHRYREQSGVSPIERLIRMRVDRARQLVMRGIRLADIAAQTGFVDQSHLSKTFRRVTGMSPRQFVQATRGSMPA